MSKRKMIDKLVIPGEPIPMTLPGGIEGYIYHAGNFTNVTLMHSRRNKVSHRRDMFIVHGSSKRNPTDNPNDEVGTALAVIRAMRTLTTMLETA